MRFEFCLKLIAKRSGLLLFAFLIVYLLAVIMFIRTPLPRGSSLGEAESHPKHQHGDLGNALELKAFRQRRYLEYQNKKHDPAAPGQGGLPVQLTKDEQREADLLFKQETFNVIASNKVPLDRSVPDTRMYEYVIRLLFDLVLITASIAGLKLSPI
jgi:hypothetical protein